MARSRSTSRTRATATTKRSPSKSPSTGRRASRKSDSEVVASKSPSRTKSPGRKAGRPKSTSAKSPARTKSPAKASPTRKRSPSKVSTTTTSSSRSRSRSRSTGSRGTPKSVASSILEKSSKLASSIGDKSSKLASSALDKSSRIASSLGDKLESSVRRTITPTHKDESPIRTPDIYHRRTPSPIFSSTRPRRAAAIAANRELMGTESARYLNTRRAVEPARASSILPRIEWPKWTRKLKNHFKAHSTFYSVLFTTLLCLIAFYLFGKQIQKQLHQIHHSLAEIYEEQRKRFDTMLWESQTEKAEKAARENALPPPPPPNHQKAPVKPPNPHIPKIPKGTVEPAHQL